ncbi:MAG: hypothetical protein K0R39_1126 [Symbiobacteriaceae bacterium]|nr:hypothetical protein [Symbiobacteriaceae bacterium]
MCLTSDTFAPLRYLPRKGAVARLISDAITPAGLTLGAHDVIARITTGALAITEEHFAFWPRRDGIEPDLVIQWKFEHEAPFWLLIEAKYRSGKSGTDAPDQAKAQEEPIRDQLAKEYRYLTHLLGADSTRSALIYLTAHRSCPEADLKDSLASIRKADAAAGSNLYWLGWHHIHGRIQALRAQTAADHELALLGDIQALLERKGLATLQPWAMAPDPASAIKETFARLGAILQNAGYLLGEMDAALKKRGFTPKGSGLDAEQLKANGRTLAPAHVVRYFTMKDGPETTVLGVGCLFADADWQPVEPLLAACIFRCRADGRGPQTWWIKEAVVGKQVEMGEDLPDGFRRCAAPQGLAASAKGDWFEKAEFRPVPLVDVGTPAQVDAVAALLAVRTRHGN